MYNIFMLNMTDSKQMREDQKNLGVKEREAGNLENAVNIFSEVISWDQENNNPTGEMDALGHLRITYSLLAHQQEIAEEKRHYLEMAMDTAENILEIGRTQLEKSKNELAIPLAHSVDARMEFAEFIDEPARAEMLRQALNDIEVSITNLPGSEAHKAWVLQKRAQIQYLLGNVDDALVTLNNAEISLFNGYDEEINSGDQADMKLNIWLSGLFLAKATIYSNSNRPILARHYANAVLSIDDPDDFLVNRKNEAKKLINTL